MYTAFIMSAQFSHQIFDFAFLKGSIENSLTSAFPASEYDIHHPTMGGSLFISKADKFQKKTDALGNEYFFIGDVFCFDDLQLDKSDGHFVGIRCDGTKGTYTFFRNRNSHIGLYYAGDHLGSAVFSTLFRTQKKLQPFYGKELSAEALDDYFQHGFVTFGQTPFQRIKQLPFRKQLQLKSYEYSYVSEPEVSLVDDVLVSPKAFFDFFQERMELWLRKASFNSIAISGGIDSRFLIACWLSKNVSRETKLYSRLHPSLAEDQDLDVLVAKKIAALTHLPHGIQKPSSLPSAFLSQEPPCRPAVLSGLYGGEYLGGEFLNLVSLEKWDQKLAGTGIFAETVMSRRKTNPLDDDVQLKLEILAQSSFCRVYDASWGAIAVHHNLTLTPFWDSYFIEALSRMPAVQLQNYSLYRQLYSYLPRPVREIPLHSQMNHYFKDYAHAQNGINPKLIPRNSDYTTISYETRDSLPSKMKSAPSDSELLGFQNFLYFSQTL